MACVCIMGIDFPLRQVTAAPFNWASRRCTADDTCVHTIKWLCAPRWARYRWRNSTQFRTRPRVKKRPSIRSRSLQPQISLSLGTREWTRDVRLCCQNFWEPSFPYQTPFRAQTLDLATRRVVATNQPFAQESLFCRIRQVCAPSTGCQEYQWAHE